MYNICFIVDFFIFFVCYQLAVSLISFYCSHFGIYNVNETVIPMKRTKIFKEDLIGLRTLYKRKALHIKTIEGVGHHYWYRNASVILNHILPWLT